MRRRHDSRGFSLVGVRLSGVGLPLDLQSPRGLRGAHTARMGIRRGLIVGRLAELGDLARDELEPHIYHKEDGDAVGHLLRVACGLDSQLLGETQILGQVSQAFASARSNGTSGPLLTYLFSRAAHAGKRARSETEISRGATSISHAAVVLLEKELGDLSSRSVLVVGAGETAELAVQALHKHGAREVSLHQSYPLERSGPRSSLRLPGSTVGGVGRGSGGRRRGDHRHRVSSPRDLRGGRGTRSRATAGSSLGVRST